MARKDDREKQKDNCDAGSVIPASGSQNLPSPVQQTEPIPDEAYRYTMNASTSTYPCTYQNTIRRNFTLYSSFSFNVEGT